MIFVTENDLDVVKIYLGGVGKVIAIGSARSAGLADLVLYVFRLNLAVPVRIAEFDAPNLDVASLEVVVRDLELHVFSDGSLDGLRDTGNRDGKQQWHKQTGAIHSRTPLSLWSGVIPVRMYIQNGHSKWLMSASKVVVGAASD